MTTARPFGNSDRNQRIKLVKRIELLPLPFGAKQAVFAPVEQESSTSVCHLCNLRRRADMAKYAGSTAVFGSFTIRYIYQISCRVRSELFA